ncbi:5-Methylcytosine G/T mismatch-specific DNA glycosylase [Aspergillus carlsbadensis]|nr:5-Methylcytosine G/T mismatch-specific DNA glycosylase [Aspergillus carlsbadensis]
MIEDAGFASDFFLSDSTLSDVPSDLDSVPDSPSPSPRQPAVAANSLDDTVENSGEAVNIEPLRCVTPPSRERPPLEIQSPPKHTLVVNRKKPRTKLSKVSPYFPGPLVHADSCLPFPPIDAPAFGLIQEQLAHDPFRLLLATIFLNRTRGGVALPVLFRVFDHYPTIEAMAAAEPSTLTSMINCLGFQNQRAKKCITLAQTWIDCPPCRGKRYRKLNYPRKLDGRDVKPRECIDDDDTRVAWEIAHLPGVGAYALDSWRIFCRDELQGLARDWQGDGAATNDFVPEWKSVLPQDKELRAYLTWMWLKEGWVWDRVTGQTTRASDKVMRAARRGGTAHMEEGNWTLEMSPVKQARY